MRLLKTASLTFTACSLLAIACSGPSPHGENVIRQSEPIQGGTLDQTDSAVVAILINTPQGMALCSGSLIAKNLVLSAHHCVATPPNNVSCGSGTFSSVYSVGSFVVTTSYDAAAIVFDGNSPTLPAPDGVTWFGVDTISVPGQSICGQDMSALTLSAPITGICPLVPSVDTDVTVNEMYKAVGFGITSPNGQTAGTRYDVSGMTVQCAETCDDPTQQSNTEEWLGVNSGNKGTCEGDSGGPALDSLGRIIGTVSRGPSNECNQTVYESVYGEATWIKQVAAAAATAGGYTAAGWVTGGATSNPANGYCGSSTSDAGAGKDAGSTTDNDSGTHDSGDHDGGTHEDAGLDDAALDGGQPAHDSGVSDSGLGTADSGHEVDSGAAKKDASTGALDAARPAVDSGHTTLTLDATSSEPDAGEVTAGNSGGCGCRTAGGTPRRSNREETLALASLALALALMRRRRVRMRTVLSGT